MENGQEREKNVSKSDYFSNGYFTQEQLFSLIEQLQHVKLCLDKLNIDSDKIRILEIGKGNGFVSNFFKSMGLDVTTFDINENLEPDVVGDILKLSEYFEDNTFDLVICCEVLEHLPFEYLEKSLKQIFKVNSKMFFLTLPEFKSFSGLGILIRIFNKRKFFTFNFGTKAKHKLAKQHFWELDSSERSSKEEIKKLLKVFFNIINIGRFKLNPYHNFFILSKKQE